MTTGDFAQVLTGAAAMIAAVVGIYNAWNTRRIERNTNSMSERSEDIAKALGVAQGKASEKANPS